MFDIVESEEIAVLRVAEFFQPVLWNEFQRVSIVAATFGRFKTNIYYKPFETHEGRTNKSVLRKNDGSQAWLVFEVLLQEAYPPK